EMDAELLRQGEIQRARFEARIRHVGGNPAAVEGREEFPAEQGLAGPDLARDLDEALAVRHRDQKGVQRLLDRPTGEEVGRVRRDAERVLAQAEMTQVVHRAAPASFICRLMPSRRWRVSRKSRSHSRSDSMTVGLSRITSSFFASDLLVFRRASGAP